MSNPEVKIRLSLDGAQQVQAGAQNAAASMDKLGGSLAEISVSSQSAAATLQRIESLLGGMQQKAKTASDALAQATNQVDAATKVAATSVEKITLTTKALDAVAPASQKVAGGLKQIGEQGEKTGRQFQASGQQVAQVSAQLQDLFIQIQGGQAPLTALLQQGSQLSTVFGGVGSAARVVAGTVGSMINPFTVAASAAGLLAAGYFKGAQEAQEFNKTLILTGNAAGVTAGQLSRMSASIAGISGGTQARAAEVLNQMAASGRIGAENLQRFTAAAIALERAGGAAAEETAKAFADLAKAPLDSVLKLNEATNFLTASQLRQIKTLEDQGKTTEAAKAAQEAYASALDKRTPAMLENLGLVERAWLGIKDAAKSAGDAILDIGRAPNALQEEIKALEARIAANNRDAQGGGQMAQEAIARGNAILTARLRLLQQAAGWESQSAYQQAQQIENSRTLAKFQSDADKYLNNKTRMEREIVLETARGQKLVEAGLIKQSELAERLNAIREKYADKSGKPADPFTADRSAAEEWAKFYGRFTDLAEEAAGKVGQLTKSQVELSKFLQSTAYANMAEPARQLALSQAYAAVSAEQLAEAQAAGAKTAAEAAKEHARYIDTLEKSADQVASQVLKLQDEESAAALVAQRYGSLAQSIEAVTIKRLQEKQISMMGNEEAVLAIQKEIDARQKLIGLIGNKEARELATKATLDGQRRIEDAIMSVDRTAQRVWTDFGDDAATAAQRAGRTIKAAVWDLLYQMTIKKWVVNIAANVLGATGVPGVGGAGGVLGAASSASNLYNAAGAAAGIWGSSAAYGAALGTTSIGAGSQAAMLASQTGVFGAEGAAMTAAAAGNAAAGSVMSSVAAAAPYLAAVLAVVAIAKSLDDSGTIHTGASSEYSSAKGLATGMGLYGVGSKAGAYGAQTEIMTTEIAKGIVGILDSTASTFGKEAGYQAASAFADDTSKDGAWGALSIKIGDKIVEGFGQDGNGRWPGQSFSDGQAGTQEYLAAVSADVRRALEQIGLPQWATNMLDQLGEAPSLDQLAQTVATINATQAALAGLGDAMPAFAALTNGATQTLLEAFGGINNLASTAQGYYQNFYTEAERAARTTQLVSKELADLGFAMPTTREGFRALVEQQLAMGDAGAKTAAELLKLQGAFASVVAETALAGEVFDQTAADLARAAETMAEAGRRALASLAEDQGSLMVDLLNAQGKTAEAQALARQQALAKITAGLSAADTDAATAAYDYNQSLRDQVAALLAATDAQKQAAEAAAQAERTAQAAAEAAISAAQQRAAAIASEGYGLTTRLLQAQGNTAELRRRELEALDPANRAILESIFALEDQKAATDAAAQAAAQAARDQEQAAETAARAAERLRDAWQSVSDSLFDEVSRIRGLISGADEPASLAAAQARFTITNAQALAGDQEAAKLLPTLSRTLLELAEAQATSLAELQRIRAQAAAGLETTGNTIAGRYGLSIPKLATGTNYVPKDMLAMLHEGEQVVPKAYNPAAAGGADVAALVKEIQGLREQVARLEASGTRGADAAEKSRDVLVSVTENGRAMQTEAAS